MVDKNLKKKVIQLRQEVMSFLSDLVAIPSTNPPGLNYKECVQFISESLWRWGIPNDVVTVPDGEYRRYAILGSCGGGEKSLHFHGHYDVVPANDPRQFQPRLKKGCLYGRGSSDMKGGLAVMLFALRLINEGWPEIDGRVSFSVVPDEETGGRLGTQYLLESGILPHNSLGMLMPEPTSGVVWNGNKGALTLRVTVKGRPAHVGLAGQGINAFEKVVEVASSFFRLKRKIEKRKTKLSVFPPEARSSVMLVGGESGSGAGFNVVPDRAFFTVDRRLNPEEALSEAKKELMDVLTAYRKTGLWVEAEVLQEGVPSFASPESTLAQSLRQSIVEVTGREPEFGICPGLCEIRFFNRRSVPAYAYGPGLLEVSHGPAEYVRLLDILSCIQVYALTAARLLSPDHTRV